MIPRQVSSFFLLAALQVFSAYAWAQPASPNAPAPRGAPAPPSDNEKATELFLEGKKFFAEGKLEDAYKAYKTAWSFKKRYDIAGNLGNVAFELGKMRDAAEYLSYCKLHFPASSLPEQRAKLEKLLGEALKHVGTVSITLREKGRIYLDGDPFPTGEGPVDKLEVFVEPGKRTILVKRPGFKPTQNVIEVEAGSTQDLEMDVPAVSLEPAAAIRPVTPAVTVVEVVVDPALQTRRRAILIAGMSVAGAGVLVGTVTAIVSTTKQTAADEKYNEIAKAGDPQACTKAAFRPTCDEVISLQKSHDTLANTAIWSFIGSSLVAGATAAYYMLSAPPSRVSPKNQQNAPSVSLAVTRQGAKITVSGTF